MVWHWDSPILVLGRHGSILANSLVDGEGLLLKKRINPSSISGALVHFMSPLMRDMQNDDRPLSCLHEGSDSWALSPTPTEAEDTS